MGRFCTSCSKCVLLHLCISLALLSRNVICDRYLFGFLRSSRRQYYDTIPFCLSFKDYDGEAINIREQKDVNEFASQFLDQLSERLKGTRSSGLVDNVFRGTLLHQVVSDECSHTSEQEEPFYMLSLTVNNKANVHQALSLYVEGDRLDGDNRYMCAGCQGKVAALKRTCFDGNSLPQTLILHLKRFTFDFDTMRKNKVNDRFEFPEILSVEPFTKQYVCFSLTLL